MKTITLNKEQVKALVDTIFDSTDGCDSDDKVECEKVERLNEVLELLNLKK
jgi:hypothetical protein